MFEKQPNENILWISYVKRVLRRTLERVEEFFMGNAAKNIPSRFKELYIDK